MDEPRRVARRPRGRVRPARRHLFRVDHRRRGACPDFGRRVGHAAALLPQRARDRLHLGPWRGRQYLGDGPRRIVPTRDHQGEIPHPQPGQLGARRQFHRRPQAFHFVAVVGRWRDVALSPHRRRRRANDQGPHQAEGHQRARLLARRPLPLFFRRRDAWRDVRIFEGRQRPDLRHPAARPADRRDRQLRHRPRRRDPSDPLARRQVVGLHPPHSLQIDAHVDGLGVRPHHPANRHARPRHAGNLGGAGRLPRHQLDPRQSLDRLLGRRHAPPHRRRHEGDRRHPVPRRRHPLRRRRPAPAEGGRPRPLRRQDGPLRPHQPRRPPHRL